jgi:hypothetical protein
MASGSLVQHTHGAVVGQGALVGREVSQWLLARVSDGGHEASFTLETDERFLRLRRVVGGTGSMLEARLPMQVTAGDLAQAVARWAHSAGLHARVHHDGAALRMTLTRPQD